MWTRARVRRRVRAGSGEQRYGKCVVAHVDNRAVASICIVGWARIMYDVDVPHYMICGSYRATPQFLASSAMSRTEERDGSDLKSAVLHSISDENPEAIVLRITLTLPSDDRRKKVGNAKKAEVDRSTISRSLLL